MGLVKTELLQRVDILALDLLIFWILAGLILAAAWAVVNGNDIVSDGTDAITIPQTGTGVAVAELIISYLIIIFYLFGVISLGIGLVALFVQ